MNKLQLRKQQKQENQENHQVLEQLKILERFFVQQELKLEKRIQRIEELIYGLIDQKEEKKLERKKKDDNQEIIELSPEDEIQEEKKPLSKLQQRKLQKKGE